MHLDERDLERLGRLASEERRSSAEQAGWLISLAVRDWEENSSIQLTLEDMSKELEDERV